MKHVCVLNNIQFKFYRKTVEEKQESWLFDESPYLSMCTLVKNFTDYVNISNKSEAVKILYQ